MKKIDLLEDPNLLEMAKALYLRGVISDSVIDDLYIILSIAKHQPFDGRTHRRDYFYEELAKDKNLHIGEYQIKRIDLDWRRDIPATELARRQARLDLLP